MLESLLVFMKGKCEIYGLRWRARVIGIPVLIACRTPVSCLCDPRLASQLTPKSVCCTSRMSGMATHTLTVVPRLVLSEQVVHTGWAMLTLIASEQWEDREDVRLALWRGSLFLRSVRHCVSRLLLLCVCGCFFFFFLIWAGVVGGDCLHAGHMSKRNIGLTIEKGIGFSHSQQSSAASVFLCSLPIGLFFFFLLLSLQHAVSSLLCCVVCRLTSPCSFFTHHLISHTYQVLSTSKYLFLRCSCVFFFYRCSLSFVALFFLLMSFFSFNLQVCNFVPIIFLLQVFICTNGEFSTFSSSVSSLFVRGVSVRPQQQDAAAHGRLVPGRHNGRLQPQHRHHLHLLPQCLPHLGSRKVRLSVCVQFKHRTTRIAHAIRPQPVFSSAGVIYCS